MSSFCFLLMWKDETAPTFFFFLQPCSFGAELLQEGMATWRDDARAGEQRQGMMRWHTCEWSMASRGRACGGGHSRWLSSNSTHAQKASRHNAAAHVGGGWRAVAVCVLGLRATACMGGWRAWRGGGRRATMAHGRGRIVHRQVAGGGQWRTVERERGWRQGHFSHF
jgi:hypothetical protein